MAPQIFIISYDEGEVQLPSDVTEFHLTTKTTIAKGFLNTKVTDFTWQTRNGTSGSTRIEDEILKRLNNDAMLHSLLLKELSNERNITLKSYKPKKTPQQTAAEASHAQIAIYGDIRKRKDIFMGRNGFDMYNKIAEHVLQAKTTL